MLILSVNLGLTDVSPVRCALRLAKVFFKVYFNRTLGCCIESGAYSRVGHVQLQQLADINIIYLCASKNVLHAFSGLPEEVSC